MIDLKILPFGGLGEIGMNCMALEYGDDIIVIDCGLLFSDLEHFGVEFVVPDFSYLRERKDKIRALVITHGHEDHIGAIPFAVKAGIRAPIYAPRLASLMIRERLLEAGIHNDVELKSYMCGDSIDLGVFKIRTVPVNHSIVDTAALIIDTPVGKIVHTADFKIDQTPFLEKPIDLSAFEKAGDEGVLLLLSDSTNVEVPVHSLSEQAIYKTFEQLFTNAEGLTIVSMFSSNVSRMAQVFELAKKHEKKIVLSGRSMEQNIALAEEAGFIRGLEAVRIGVDDIDSYPRHDVVVLSTGSQGEARSSLIRMAQGEHKSFKLIPGDRVIMSSKFIPGNEKAIGRMINSLFKQGADVLYESVEDIIHVSGHAGALELQKMIELVRPKFFIPIHGEFRHLVHHTRLAKKVGVKKENVLLASNGDIIEVNADKCKIAGRLDENRVLVESRQGNDISKLVLKDRRQLGEKGVVFTIIVRDGDSGDIVSGPEIITRGLAEESLEKSMVSDAKKIVVKIVKEYEENCEERGPAADLQELIRVELRRFFRSKIQKKPVVLPIILDL